MSKLQGKPEPADTQQVTRGQFLQIFSAVMLPMFLAAADQTLLATATPVIAADFGQLHDTSWLSTAYLLTNAVMITVYGRLGDRYGRREVLFVAMAIFVLGSVVCAAAPTLGWLIAGRALQGLGGGGLMTLSHALIGELVPPRQRLRFQGYFAIIFTAANVLGPVIGGIVVAQVSWRWLFIAQLPVTALATWRLFLLPRGERHPAAPGVSDIGGLLLFTAGTAMLLFGLSSSGHRFAWLSPWTFLLFGGGGLAWLLLLMHERRHRAAFFPIDLFRIPAMALAMVTVLCSMSCTMAMVFYLPIYLQFGMHTGAGRSGLLLVPLMLGLVTGGQFALRIAARMGQLNVMPVVGMTLASLALAGLALSPPREAIVVTLGFVAGLGLGPTMPITQMLAQMVAGREHLGAAVALVSLARTVGAALGVAVIGAIIYGLLPDINIAELIQVRMETDESRAVLRAFHAAFFTAAMVAAFGAFNAWRVPRVKI